METATKTTATIAWSESAEALVLACDACGLTLCGIETGDTLDVLAGVEREHGGRACPGAWVAVGETRDAETLWLHPALPGWVVCDGDGAIARSADYPLGHRYYSTTSAKGDTLDAELVA